MKKFVFILILVAIVSCESEEVIVEKGKERQFNDQIERILLSNNFKVSNETFDQSRDFPFKVEKTGNVVRTNIVDLAIQYNFEIVSEEVSSTAAGKESEWTYEKETYVTGVCTYTIIEYSYKDDCLVLATVSYMNWCTQSVTIKFYDFYKYE